MIPAGRLNQSFHGQPVESWPWEGRVVGRSDLGWNDVHRPNVQRRPGEAGDLRGAEI